MSLVVLIGGARSGKSALAVSLAGETATMIATATAGDAEMAERIRLHREARPDGWTTIEEPLALGEAVESVPDGRPLVVDCLSLWVANAIEAGWRDDLIEGVSRAVAAAAAAREALTVAVSNEVGLGVVPATPLGRRYRDVLGRVNAEWAAESERALLVVAGRVVELERF